jgi:hypothetical protein
MIYIILTIIVIVCIILIVLAYEYNSIQDYIIRLNEADISIENVLKKRFDLLDKSVKIIKKETNLDKEILSSIDKNRSKTMDNIDLDNALYDAIVEFKNYGDEFESSEIFALRDYYNDIANKYNELTKKVPGNIVAKFKKYRPKKFFETREKVIQRIE